MITFVVPISNEEIYERDVKSSKIYKDGQFKFIEKRGYKTCREAFNDVLDNEQIDTELICFLHQDVYMREGFENELRTTLNNLDVLDPNFGVLGPAGAKYNPNGYPFLVGACFWWCYNQMWGNYNLNTRMEIAEVDTLDCQMFIVKTSDIKDFRFDLGYKYNHFYSEELCLRMKDKGKKNYAIPTLVEHRCLPLDKRELDREFEELKFCGDYSRDKYQHLTPFATTCLILENNNIKFL